MNEISQKILTETKKLLDDYSVNYVVSDDERFIEIQELKLNLHITNMGLSKAQFFDMLFNIKARRDYYLGELYVLSSIPKANVHVILCAGRPCAVYFVIKPRPLRDYIVIPLQDYSFNVPRCEEDDRYICFSDLENYLHHSIVCSYLYRLRKERAHHYEEL